MSSCYFFAFYEPAKLCSACWCKTSQILSCQNSYRSHLFFLVLRIPPLPRDFKVLSVSASVLSRQHFHSKLYSIFWCIFLSLYFMLYYYMTGLSLWNSKHEHNTVIMLCSLKKCYITIPTGLSIMATSLQGPLASVPKVAIVERFDYTWNVQNINVLIS